MYKIHSIITLVNICLWASSTMIPRLNDTSSLRSSRYMVRYTRLGNSKHHCKLDSLVQHGSSSILEENTKIQNFI